jgi:hypothetical protein
MDWSWLNKFSGGLDVIPVFIALGGLVAMRRLGRAQGIEQHLARLLAIVCFVALPVAQIGWIAAVIQGIPFMGTLLDNVWTIYNFASLFAILLLLHTTEPRQRGNDSATD